MENKTILLFGGTGSLGYEIVKRYIEKNSIYNYPSGKSIRIRILQDLGSALLYYDNYKFFYFRHELFS